MGPLMFDPCPTVDSRDPKAYARYAARLDDAIPDWWTCDLGRLVPALAAEALKRRPLPCISVRQPWARLIDLGIKGVENRNRRVNHRGLVGIHASQAIDKDALRHTDVRQALGIRDAARWAVGPDCATGVIVAVAELTDCHSARSGPACCKPWGETSDAGTIHHLVLANVRRLPTPVPAKGSLALPWTAPPEVAAQVWVQLAEVAP